MQLTESKVKSIYRRFICKSKRACERGRFNDCCRYLRAASHTAYNFYLGFRNEDIECLLKQLAARLNRRNLLSVDVNSCVLYDSFSLDNGGLVQQYLTAIMAAGMNLTYITERRGFLSSKSAIHDQLEAYGKCKIIEIPSRLGGLYRAQYVYDEIIRSRAGHLFIHTNPSAVDACVAFYALPEDITKYKINLTDHTFWVGTDFIDYSFEFRPYGCVLSNQERGLSSPNIFYLPFYPIIRDSSFLGFPAEADGKTVFFSGGAFYKVFDAKDTYFKMVKSILDNCENAIFLYAGAGDVAALSQKIKQYNLEHRFFIIGQRPDITEVFRHCDIYLNTYPFGGGLMTQYAAQLGKPILNYCCGNTSKVEEFVCQKKMMDISVSSFEELVLKARRLCDDLIYRKEYGESIRSCVVSPIEFNKLFLDCVQSGINQLDYSADISMKEYEILIDDKIQFENSSKCYQRAIVKIFGKRSVWICPDMLLDALCVAIKQNKLLSVIKNNR